MSAVDELSALVHRAHAHSKLSTESFAVLSRISADRLNAIEQRLEPPTASELDAVARLLGVELEELLQGELGTNSLFFRSMNQELAIDDLFGEGDGLVLGDFARCAKRVARLRERCGEPLPHPSWMEQIKPEPLGDQDPPAHGQQLAHEVRQLLGLANAPIPSMRRMLNALGIEVFFLHPGQLQVELDGACIIGATPAILVNPLYEDAPWSLRATMAHELCHLFFDRQPQGLFFLSTAYSTRAASKRREHRWALFDTYLDTERRANAFAAHLLAPLDAIKALISTAPHQPATVDAAYAVCAAFGVSYELAVNQLCRAYALTNQTREELLREPRRYELSFAYDELPERRGLFDGQLLKLTLSAYKDGLVDAVEARRLLALPMSSALPELPEVELSEQQRAPLLSSMQRALKHVWRHLYALDAAGVRPAEVTATPLGWLVELVREDNEGRERTAGYLELTHDFELRRGEVR